METDFLDEPMDGPAKEKRAALAFAGPRTTARARRGMLRKKTLQFEEEGEDDNTRAHKKPTLPECAPAPTIGASAAASGMGDSEATMSWQAAAAARQRRRDGLLASAWTSWMGAEQAGEAVEKAVAGIVACLKHYGVENVSEEDARVRLLCLGDRVVRAMGGSLEDDLDDFLLVIAMVLLKMWCDTGFHFHMIQHAGADPKTVARLERKYLTLIAFKTHISHRQIYDFSTDLRAFFSPRKEE